MAWDMIRIRRDLRFFFITQRIECLAGVLPPDWSDGYEPVAIGCTVENRAAASSACPPSCRFLSSIGSSSAHRCSNRSSSRPGSPRHRAGVGLRRIGEEARICYYDWILSLRDQCGAAGIPFSWHLTGARLLKDGRIYRIPRRFQHSQARKAGIDFR